MYGDGRAEKYIGAWLQKCDREDYVIASTIYLPTREDPNGRGLGRKHLRHSIDAILDHLQTYYVDLLYIHRWDDDTLAEEFMATLNEFVRDGKVPYLGTSTFEPNAWKVAKTNEIAAREGYEPFTVAQPRYNAVNREVEGNYLETCADYDLGIVPWSPLAGGFLTGKYNRGEDPPEGSRGATDEMFRDSYLTTENFDAADVDRSPEQFEAIAQAK